MRRTLFLVLLTLLPFVANAYHLKFGGIYYNIYGNNATVTYQKFQNNSYISDYSGSVIIPESFTYKGKTYTITNIGDYAFSGCSSLTSVTIPNSVTSIGDWAFNNCGGLTSVTIGNSVTSIGENAFYLCSSLTSITMPNSVTSIGRDAFSGCTGLTSITIPNSVTSIENGAFFGCSGLTSITMPNSVTSIGRDAFSGCTGLTSITIPNSVTSIENEAFFGCSGLTSITIPNSVTSIGDWAFYGCPLRDVYCYAEEVPSTSSNPFDNIKNATLYVPESAIGQYKTTVPWSNFGSIVSIEAENPNIIFADANVKAICVENWDMNYDGDLSYAEAAAVKDFGNVFQSNNTITLFKELQYFTGVTSIENGAFFNCSSLTTITIPNSVTSIGDNAFDCCSSLKDVYCAAERIPSTDVNTFDNSRIAYATLHVPESVKEQYKTTVPWSSFGSIVSIEAESPNINFVYANVKAICVEKWDTNHDGELSYAEAATVKSLGEVFKGNEHVKSFNELKYFIGLTSIDNSAFSGCSRLTSIIIPNSVTSIGHTAFFGCRGLTSIIIPNSVTSIGNGAFSDCSRLTSIIIPNSVTSIDNFAFSGCSRLTSITIPNSVTSIGDSAFEDCSSLTSITIPNSIIRIEEQAFGNCSSLTDVYCAAESIPRTDVNAFVNSSIASATLHVPYSAIEQYKKTEPWSGFGRIVSIEADSPIIIFADTRVKEICVTNWDTNGDGELCEAEAAAVRSLENVFQSNKNITSFDELQCFTGLTSIGNNAFRDCSSLTSVTIPNSVSSIGDEAFWFCGNLTSIIIPNSLTSIGRSTFYNCTKLTSITIPNSVTNIGDSAFSGCSSLHYNEYSNAYYLGNNENPYVVLIKSKTTQITSCEIIASCKFIYTRAFSGCSGLTSINIPEGVTSIGASSFQECSRLTSITIPNSVTSIGWSAFNSCSSLNSIKVEAGNTTYDSRNNCNAIIETFTNTLIAGCVNTIIPNSVTSIGDNAFSDCGGLTSVTIPNSVTSIGWGAFYGCSGLTSITIPNSVISIGNWAFDNCSGLTSIKVEAGNTTYDSRNNCNAIIKTFTNTLIVGCMNTIIPNSVTSIGEHAFYGCYSLTSITIPNSVTSIGSGAFSDCEGLTDVYCYAESVPSTYSNAFEYSPIDAAKLYVPQKALDAYSTTSPWSSFNVILPIPEYVLTYMVDGKIYKTFSILYGSEITPEAEPTKEGYTFSGWSDIPEMMPAGDFVVTGTFTVNSYTLSYMVDGEEYKTSSVEYGTTLTPEEEPTKEGYTFSGWSEIPETMPAEDVVITGSFIINQYLLTYILDGEEYKSYKVDYNSTITPEPAPVKKGMTFSGWGEVPETMPACDLTLTGSYSWSKETVDGVIYQVTDTLSNYASVVGTESIIEEATILPYIEIGGDTYEVYSIAEDALPKTVTIYVPIGKLLLWLWTNGYEDIRETDSGRSLTAPEVSLVTATASSLTLFYANEYPELTETVMVSGSPVEKKQNGYKVMLRGLEPDNLYEELATLTLTYEDASYTKSFSFRTNPLTLTTEQPKVVSLGNVVVAAKSNLDDTELNVGFEWRRIDWTDDFASNYGTAYLFEGMMEGYIRNLNADKLWKYRPYYTSNAGNSYYGSWVGIDPSNTSYFLPTIHTYSRIIQLGNWAEIWGYVMRGTDNISKQGFIYWNMLFPSSRRNANGIPSDAKTILSSGNVMSATLENLEYDTEYCYMAFVTTTEGETFYGEPQTFRTDPVDPDAISLTPAVPEVEEQVYDLNGRKLNKPQKGINIIRYSDGTTRKVMIK